MTLFRAGLRASKCPVPLQKGFYKQATFPPRSLLKSTNRNENSHNLTALSRSLTIQTLSAIIVKTTKHNKYRFSNQSKKQDWNASTVKYSKAMTRRRRETSPVAQCLHNFSVHIGRAEPERNKCSRGKNFVVPTYSYGSTQTHTHTNTHTHTHTNLDAFT